MSKKLVVKTGWQGFVISVCVFFSCPFRAFAGPICNFFPWSRESVSVDFLFTAALTRLDTHTHTHTTQYYNNNMYSAQLFILPRFLLKIIVPEHFPFYFRYVRRVYDNSYK